MRYNRFYQRRSEQASVSKDFRTPTQRDRDRVLHSSTFRRLASVSQVVDPGEGREFHNRLTHSLKVAQIGRRIAEKLLGKKGRLCNEYGGIDPDVVETAALCHDLGHPPFGHITEKVLDKCLTSRGLADGFEGNAQSFRIITKLAIRRDSHAGLNLTRASLNATLKYPWTREPSGKRNKKWGAYSSERDDLEWARELSKDRPNSKSLEAEVMDFADDIAYSVHDMEDFYRAGLVPLHELAFSEAARQNFLDRTYKRWIKENLKEDVQSEGDFEPYREVFNRLVGKFPISEIYIGMREQRAKLRDLTSSLVARYVNGISLRKPSVSKAALIIPENHRYEIAMLKELTWQFVIINPALTTQQYGRERLIEDLFTIYFEAIQNGKINIFPPRVQEEIEEEEPNQEIHLRLVADTISSMADQEAYRTHGRLMGYSPGSVLDTLPY
jgi:dGTPase